MLVAGEGDSFLLEPTMLAMGQGIVAVFDRGDMSLKGIDRGAGRLLWTLGRAGSGPWEFAQVMDVAVGPADSVWVLDLENRRIYVAGPNGSKGRVVNLADALAGSRLGSANPSRIALLPDGIALGMDRAENGDLVALLSWEGRHRGGIEGPAWIRELPWLAADYSLGGDFAKGGLGLAFVYTGRVLAVADDADPPGLREIEAIETRGEPEIVRFTFMGMDASRFAPGQVRFARDVAVQDESVAVLTARQDREDGFRTSSTCTRKGNTSLASASPMARGRSRCAATSSPSSRSICSPRFGNRSCPDASTSRRERLPTEPQATSLQRAFASRRPTASRSGSRPPLLRGSAKHGRPGPRSRTAPAPI